MAVHIEGMLEKTLNEKIKDCKLLVVGAGGIGCELLKNLVLTGFEQLHVIDLDTIELSNLNRQFLFHKQHIGRPKAIVAKESVLKFNPKANITAYHDSITSTKYNVDFFKQFTAVANALDNVAARSHVNRMCIAADIPLIESGSSGFFGQVTVYKNKTTECFDCLQRKGARTFPSCTIRNTPSEPAHCIVWGKHLFNQLFGEIDEETEVSPDMADPELGDSAVVDGRTQTFSTREWAKSANYDPVAIFKKLFNEDIKYLNAMHHLWEDRKKPQTLDWDKLPDAVAGSSKSEEPHIKDQIVWNIKECAEVMQRSLAALKERQAEEGPDSILTWDKDDDEALDFVAACANLRSYCFHISLKSRFDVKAIAGNIVPAIATTNAVIAGLLVLQAIKILQGDLSQCRTAWLNNTARDGCKLISSAQLEKPNPKCMVCSPVTPEVFVTLNLKTLTVKSLDEKILKEKLNMVQPDVIVNDGTAKIILSSDPEDMEGLTDKTLSELKVKEETKLVCEDFFQQYKVILAIKDSSEMRDQEFEIHTDVKELLKKQMEETSTDSTSSDVEVDNDCLEVLDADEIDIVETETTTSKKKPLEDENGILPPAKKARMSVVEVL